MSKRSRRIVLLMCLVLLIAAIPLTTKIYRYVMRSPANLVEVRQRVELGLRADLRAAGLELGQATFIRIFKEERNLEVWLRGGQGYRLFKSYDICNFSGNIGPKLKEGDRQSPEGFYGVDQDALNPNSSYHLSFNLGFPNIFDQANQRTGSFLMVHGRCVSIGCYAMTDAGIEEIYLIVEAALSGGQDTVPVHAFPFRMTDDRLALEQGNMWFEYWRNLKTGFDLFEAEGVPPIVSVTGKAYAFRSGLDI